MMVTALSGCGYHTVGQASRLPARVHSIAVPMFVNQTQTYRIEQILTRDVVREFLSRSHYHVVNNAGESSDAVLKGTVISAQASPLTYDAQSGRISSAARRRSMPSMYGIKRSVNSISNSRVRSTFSASCPDAHPTAV